MTNNIEYARITAVTLASQDQIVHEFYFFPSDTGAQRVRLALGYKKVAYRDVALDYADDETFFELGIGRRGCVLRLVDGTLLDDSLVILERADALLGGPPILEGVLPAEAWQALLTWRRESAALLDRLYAPVRPAYSDIANSEANLAAYKAEVQQRFGLGVEALSNDRYAAYTQFAARSRLNDLARHLARERFYYDGAISAADLVLAADLYPLQLLDGISLPLDLMYYFERVAGCCKTDLREHLALR